MHGPLGPACVAPASHEVQCLRTPPQVLRFAISLGMKGQWFLDSTANADPFAFQYSVTEVIFGGGVNIS